MQNFLSSIKYLYNVANNSIGKHNFIQHKIEILIKKLKLLERNIMENNLKEVLKILSILVPEWNAKF